MTPLTDSELAEIDRASPYDGYDRRIFGNSADRLIAQAREANALRSQLSTALATAALLTKELERCRPVVEAAERYCAMLADDRIEYDDVNAGELDAAVSTYRSAAPALSFLGTVSFRDGKLVEATEADGSKAKP